MVADFSGGFLLRIMQMYNPVLCSFYCSHKMISLGGKVPFGIHLWCVDYNYSYEVLKSVVLKYRTNCRTIVICYRVFNCYSAIVQNTVNIRVHC